MITFLVQYFFPGKRSFFSTKALTARDLLGSFAADGDLILDWWFYIDVWMRRPNDADTTNDILAPEILQRAHLAFIILGTLAWGFLATDGRLVDYLILKPILFCHCIWRSLFMGCQIDGKCLPIKALMTDTKNQNLWNLSTLELSTGFLILIGIFLEDIPQIIITFQVGRYDTTGMNSATSDGLSGIAVANLLSSLYNALIKLADAFDQRTDVVTVASDGGSGQMPSLR